MRPQLAAFTAAGPYAQALRSQVLARLSAEEAAEWRAAVGQAERDGTFFIARPYHCAVGTKSRQG